MSVKVPIFKPDDSLYVYKENWFTNFAPCFDNGVLTLACCKGNMCNGGMRASACMNYNSGKSVWVFGIAGKDISKKGQNASEFEYVPGNAIYLAKVSGTETWEEYGKKYDVRLDNEPVSPDHRLDAIYYWKDGKMNLRENKHHGIECMDTDCAKKKKDFQKLKQIIFSEEFYIFYAGNSISEYNVKRGYRKCKYEDIKTLEKYINDNPECYKYNYVPRFNSYSGSCGKSCD